MPAPSTVENKETMREWASANGKAIRQRIAHQETTMAKAGTLPESFYHQESKPADASEDIECNSDDSGNNENKNLEYDTDNSLEDCLENCDEDFETSKEGTFFVGKIR